MTSIVKEYREILGGMKLSPASWAVIAPRLLVVGGLLALYVPMAVDFGQRFWWNEADSHSGMLLICVIWAYWHERTNLTGTASRTELIAGAIATGIALTIYFLGRTTFFFQLQGISLPLMVFGLTLASHGSKVARKFALLNLLLVFTIPVLGPLADSFLVPLRLAVTSAAAHFISLFGFPATSTGVIITIGFVEVNIAGACVGLQSMVSLTAIGLLFLHFYPPRSLAVGIAFVLLLPIVALGVNFLRICLLILVAGMYGASAEAQIHDLVAYAEVVAAIGIFLVVSRIFERAGLVR
ncbi:exosortase/archaeosortase family protein [Sphingobium phenoxybenzoativorans]|uniref:Exosortase/archaeosortase family protein n=1 Tax=Sphingobium phenoxybenzoativorans TaxID=1592790 RepID=A0A975K6E3_9SPHN|nr:exosortase/archaeosortase family protein [Sphingobium phenoxybenzoativorans]QUT05655.1 exosortase/archaeosortase family protein [Sphingobium phenoxybenzoativorans]